MFQCLQWGKLRSHFPVPVFPINLCCDFLPLMLCLSSMCHCSLCFPVWMRTISSAYLVSRYWNATLSLSPSECHFSRAVPSRFVLSCTQVSLFSSLPSMMFVFLNNDSDDVGEGFSPSLTRIESHHSAMGIRLYSCAARPDGGHYRCSFTIYGWNPPRFGQ